MKKLICVLGCLLFAPACSAASLAVLTDKVNEICPIYGLSGNVDNPAGLRIDFAPSATDAQKNAAREYLANIDTKAPDIQPADVNGFLLDVMRSGVFTPEQMIQMLMLQQELDQAKRDALILEFAARGTVEQQAKLIELAAKHNIKLPL
jgi:hypothetical protein